MSRYPTTPDGRYFVMRGRLWRCSDPGLCVDVRERQVHLLMAARRAVRSALAAKDDAGLAVARSGVQAAKVALGERGPPWWSDGDPDYNRHMARNTPYAAWHATLASG